MYISKLKGVGKKTAHSFLKQDINTVIDLIDLKPSYDNYKLSVLSDKNHLEVVVISGVINSEINEVITSRAKYVHFKLLTNNNVLIDIYAFNQLFLAKTLSFSQEITVKGKFDYYLKRITANKVLDKVLEKNSTIISKYKVGEISSGRVRNLIQYALDNHSSLIKENLPKDFINNFKLLDRLNAYKKIHFPNNETDITTAERRFKYEETYFNELALIKKYNSRKTRKPIDYNFSFVKEMIDKIPYDLTGDQKNAVNLLFRQYKSIYPLSHVIVGDVGTGKTIVSFLLAVGAISANYQVAFMAPTEILAKQHYYNFIKLFPNFNVSLLTSKIKNREEILENIESGFSNIIFGTQSLISNKINYRNIGLAIIDEQHKFGVNVREQLKNKGRALDFIYLSATPIPRSLEMALFGTLNLVRIDDKPKGREDITTYVKNISELDEVINIIIKNQNNNKKTYIVVPAIDTENHNLTINEIYPLLNERIKENLFILHGRQSNDEQTKNLESFQNESNAVLLATSIIEVGIDDKDATLMVIIGANYFGLSALHQLRGRVGRGSDKSFCYLVSSDSADLRLETMTKVNDGLKLAEIDLKMRGPGSLLGINQSGFTKYKYLDITVDNNIISNVRTYFKKE